MELGEISSHKVVGANAMLSYMVTTIQQLFIFYPLMGDEEREKVLQAIGGRIAQIRQSKHISQQELASMCDFEKSNMSRIVAGNTNMTVMTL